MAAGVVGGNLIASQETNNIGDLWRQFDAGPSKKGAYLSALRDAIGYGGIIHEFKNYVLRMEPKRIITFHTRVREAIAALTAYRALGVSKPERAALDTIEKTILEYVEALAMAKKLVAKGMNVRAIDNRIKVDDRPALQAIKVLDEELAKARRSSAGSVYAAVATVTRLSLVSSGVTTVLLVCLTILIVWLLVRAINTIGQAVAAASAIADGDLDRIIEVRSRDESGQLMAALKRMQANLRVSIEAIRESEARIRTMMDNIPVMLNAFDDRGRIIIWNRESERVTGYTAREIFNCDDVMALLYPDPEYRCRMLQEWQDRGGRFTDWPWRLTAKDGTEKLVAWSNVSTKVPITGWSSWAIGRDITELAHSRAELEDSKQRIQTLVDHMADGLITINEKGIIRSFNCAAERLFGYAAEAVIGKSVNMLMPEPHAARHNAYLKRYTSGGKARMIGTYREVEGRRKDGTLFPMVLGLAEVSLNEERQFIGTVSDLTERKQAEQKLARINRDLMLAHRQAGMAEVASGVLHNVGNILNSINVSASLVADKLTHTRLAGLGKVVQLLDEHADDVGRFLSEDVRGRRLPAYLHSLAEHLDAEQESMLAEFKSIRNNIEHIKDIVNRQQAYATSAGVTETVLMDDLLNDVVTMSVSEKHAIDIGVEAEPLPPVRLDKAKVMQILVNLVRNAKQSLDTCDHDDKQMTVHLGDSGDGRMRISVSDNGLGIAEADREKIFQYGHTTRKGGHGFGLHASAVAAKELGGLLTFSSGGPGCGATFTLELPIEIEEIAA